MSLVDLKSDLAKYRETVTKEDKNTPESSKSTWVQTHVCLRVPIPGRLSKAVTNLQTFIVLSVAMHLTAA